MVKTAPLGNNLPLQQGELLSERSIHHVRNLGPVVLIVLILGTNSFAAPAVVKSPVLPEPGVLALLGSGLVGLATLVRRHLGD